MAPEAAAEGSYTSCGMAEVYPYSRTSSPDPTAYYDGHEDKRAYGRCEGSQYHSWPVHTSFPAYPSNEAKSYALSPYGVPPPHGVPAMSIPMTPMPYGHGSAGQMVTPQPPMFGMHPSRGRPDVTDTSSSNCTPRDHYTMEKHSPQKRHARKHEGGQRFPVVKIPEGLKKQGQPSPATWLNMRGFPLRAGKPDCKHYISKGWCAYGTLCKFNHPDNMPTTPPYGMVPCCPGSQPMVMSGPWMGHPYHWNGPWNQPPTSNNVPHGYPCMYHPCRTESGYLDGKENEQATDAESTAVYH